MCKCQKGNLLAPGPFPGPPDCKGVGIEWPPHSPDLTPPVFLWGHLKSAIYKNGPKTIVELKKAVEQAVRRIPVATCRAVMESARKRAELCLRENGGHLEQVL